MRRSPTSTSGTNPPAEPVPGRAELKETIRRYRDAFPDLDLPRTGMAPAGRMETRASKPEGYPTLSRERRYEY